MGKLMMTEIDWLDRDHVEIYELFSAVRRSADRKAWRAARSQHKALVRLAKEHFLREEAFMADHGIEPHCGEHQDLLREMALLHGHLRPGADSARMIELIRKLEERGLEMVRDDAAMVGMIVRERT